MCSHSCWLLGLVLLSQSREGFHVTPGSHWCFNLFSHKPLAPWLSCSSWTWVTMPWRSCARRSAACAPCGTCAWPTTSWNIYLQVSGGSGLTALHSPAASLARWSALGALSAAPWTCRTAVWIAPSVLQWGKSCALCACRVLRNAAEVGKMDLFNSLCHRIKKILNFFEKTQNAKDNCHYDKMMFLPVFHNRKDSGLSFLFFFCPTAPISYFLKRHMSSSFAYGSSSSLWQ